MSVALTLHEAITQLETILLRFPDNFTYEHSNNPRLNALRAKRETSANVIQLSKSDVKNCVLVMKDAYDLIMSQSIKTGNTSSIEAQNSNDELGVEVFLLKAEQRISLEAIEILQNRISNLTKELKIVTLIARELKTECELKETLIAEALIVKKKNFKC